VLDASEHSKLVLLYRGVLRDTASVAFKSRRGRWTFSDPRARGAK